MPEPIVPVAPVAPVAPVTPNPVTAPPTASNAPSAPVDTPHDGWADLDAKFKSEGSAEPKPGDEPTKKPEAAPVAAPASSPKVAAVVPKETPKEPKALREELERTRTELGTTKTSMTALEAKIKDFDKRGLDTEALTKRLEQREKEFEALQGEIRMLKQETDPAFKEKWDKPFERQAAYAQQQVVGITKLDETPFTWEKDFAGLYNLPYAAARARAIEELGPENAQTVMDEIRDLKKLDFARHEALKEEKQGWKAKSEKEAADRVQRQETIKGLQSKVRKELQDSIEDYRDAIEDKEASTARQEGYQIFDAKPKTLQEAILRDEHVRHRVAAHVPMKLTIARLKAELAKRDETIAKLKPRVPGENGQHSPGGERKTDAEPEDYDTYLRKAITA